MMAEKDQLLTVGRIERVTLPDMSLTNIPAKIDTGADSSSIWVSQAIVRDNGLHVIFFGSSSEYYTGDELVFPKGTYTITRVANSFGHREIRYKLKLRIKIKSRLIRATFTLSDRSQKLYPILVGRRLLSGKFLVDVKSGQPLREAERQRHKALKRALKDLED